MALISRVEPMVCLQWVTERPYVDGIFLSGSRLSPDFDFLQNKYYLEMKLKDVSGGYSKKITPHCEICLHRRPSSSRSSCGSLSVDCLLKVSDKSFYQSDRVCSLGGFFEDEIIFNKYIDEDQIRPSGNVEEWKVFCMFSESAKKTQTCQSASLQVGNKTINMYIHDKNVPLQPVDECVQVSQEVPRDMQALSTDISGLLEDGILPDFQLKCQGQIFQVHRSVLAARSEVFRAMFRNRMEESETASADIKDLEVPVLEFLLKFLYSGKLDDLSEDIASKLYEAADKYAVHSLLTACSYWLIRNLTVDNCIDCLITADSHSDQDLKAASVAFILSHPVVFTSTAWMAFLKEHVVLANEVLQAYAAAAAFQ